MDMDDKTIINSEGNTPDINTGDSSESEVKEAQVDYNKRYTYSDYVTWDDDQRWELIDGVPYMMSSPRIPHQKVLSNLHGQFWNFLKGKPCIVLFAPFDVRLNFDTLDDTVVQPDLLVVCDDSKLDDATGLGAPDMVVEILSPSTASYDKITKFNKYQESGVREYWIIDPDAKTLAVNILKNENYVTHLFSAEDTVPVRVLDGCEINLPDVFEE